MKLVRRNYVPLVFILLQVISAYSIAGVHDLYIGWAHGDITPSESVDLVGYPYRRISTGVDDPLTATALAIETVGPTGQKEQAIMVSCDLIWIRKDIQDRVKGIVVSALTDFNSNKLFLNATHTHQGPGFKNGDFFELYDTGNDPDVMSATEYGDFLVDRLASLAVQAWNNRRAGGLSWARGYAVTGHNRRVTYLNGLTTIFGQTNDDQFSHIEGPDFHDLETLFFFDSTNALTGMLINTSSPAQALDAGAYISADFWHDVRQELHLRYDPNVYIFPQCGAAGDQAPQTLVEDEMDNLMMQRRGLTLRQEIARRIANAVDDVYSLARTDIRHQLEFKHNVINMNLTPRIPSAQPFYQTDGLPVEIHCLQLGDVMIATAPGELYLDYGIRIQARSLAIQTLISQLSCQHVSYLPTARAVASGGYSADNYIVSPQGSQEMVNEIVRVINAMYNNAPTGRVAIIESDDDTHVSESGPTSDTFNVQLFNEPSVPITISMNFDSNHLTVSPALLTFNSTNWKQTQTVTVTAVDDGPGEGQHSAEISFAVTGGNYQGVSINPVVVTILEEAPVVNMIVNGDFELPRVQPLPPYWQGWPANWIPVSGSLVIANEPYLWSQLPYNGFLGNQYIVGIRSSGEFRQDLSAVYQAGKTYHLSVDFGNQLDGDYPKDNVSYFIELRDVQTNTVLAHRDQTNYGYPTKGYWDVKAQLTYTAPSSGGSVGNNIRVVIGFGSPSTGLNGVCADNAELSVTTVIPNITGMTQTAATTAITGADLVVGTVTQQYSSTVNEGLVISQNPASGISVYPGTAVNMVVSLGLQFIIPDVTGLSQAAAEAAITAATFTVGTVTTAYSDTVAAGNVISQNPAGGTAMASGTAVNLVVSLGLPLIPEVTNQAQAAAEAAIVAANYIVGTVTTSYSDTVVTGNVISQNPTGGTAMANGTAVNLVVSLGLPLIPDVTGLAQAAAEAAITSATFTVGTVTTAYSDTVATGNVISQSIVGPATSGTAVNLVVSLGLPLIPDVTGLAQAAAESAITAASFTIGTVTTAYSDTVVAGNVISQSIVGPATSGTAVNLVVSLGLPIIPDVTGQAQAAAEAAITAATFTVGTVTTAYSDTVATGNVISQSIVGSATSGTAVNLVVSLGLPLIPDVTGQAQAAAEAAITAASFTIGTVTTAYSDTVAAGFVISQSLTGPAASGSAVNLVVSGGPEARIISGRVLEPNGVTPIEGILITAVPDANSVVTDPNGYYAVEVPYNWSGVIEPNAAGYTFEPNTLLFTNLTGNQTDQNFIGILDAFMISGHILEEDGITPVEGVTVTPANGGGYFTNKYNEGGSGTTDPNGYYEVTVDYNWSGTVLPTKIGYTFTPPDGLYANVTDDYVDQDYTAAAIAYMLAVTTVGSGTVSNTPDQAAYHYGDAVELQANPALGWSFLGWSGDTVGSANPVTVIIDEDPNVTAAFTINHEILTITSTSGGDVTTPGEGAFSYDYSTVLSIVATADAGYQFVNWTGTAVTANRVANPNSADTTVTMDADYTIQANFALPVIPDVTGLSQAAAEAAITAATFTVGTVTTAYSDTVATGNVISQSIVGPATSGTAVNLVVSLGLPLIPDVTGLAQAAAETAITSATFTVGTVTTAYSDTVAAGLVISQSITGPATSGTAVNLVVSLGLPIIPDVTGLAQAAAETAITSATFTVGTVTTAYSDTVAAGNVISQSITGPATSGTAVNLVVSLGLPVIPDVTGQAQAAAEAAITSATFTIGTVTTAYSDTVAAGNVISQSITGPATSGTAVNLVVSLGLPIIPDVTGLAQAAAESAITTASFTIGTVTTAYSDTVATGNVISQSIVGPATSGTAVNLVVSLGLPIIPDVTGQAQAAAEAAITTATFTVGTVTTAYSDTVATGNVISQSIVGPATSGTSVNLVVSLGLPLIPEITNQAQAAAEAAIVAANYIVGTITTSYSDTVVTGNVISQNPTGGTAMASGTAVNLVVSLGLPLIPDVTGLAQAAAEAAITAATFTVGTVTTAYSDTVAAGNVISQNPTGGTAMASGTPVSLVVSLGLPIIPDVTGLAQAAAEAAITTATFTVGTVTTAYSDTVATGNVISQSITGPAASGTAVNLVVSLGLPIIPDVTGLAQAAAEAAITAATFTVGTVTTAYSDTVATGNVISQSIVGPATSGTSVNLVVSLGLPLIPEITNQAQAAAEAAIVAANYIVGTVTTSYSDTVVTGNVISQNPTGGTAMASGTAVNLVVSLGLPLIPDVTGLAQAAAEAAITAATFTVGTVTTAYSDTVAAGNVISQNPTGGTAMASGTPVSLVVSLGLPIIPDVTGLAQAAAEAAITTATFTVGTVTTAYSDTVATGNVISQNPAGSTPAASGTAIDLVVSLGLPLIPEVTGQTQAVAEAGIAASNFIVGTVTTAYSDTVPIGNVISQNPTAGTAIASGTAVDIVVSLGLPVIPDVTGQAQAAAEAAITAATFTVGTVTTAYSDTVVAGNVISQSITGPATSGTSVNLVVSLGLPIIPDVTGQVQAAAEAAITAATFTVGTVTTAYSDTVVAGNVISQSITGPATSGTSVNLVVSLGLPIIPDVTGQVQAAAEAAITAASFTIGTVTTAYSDTVATGNVISQSITGPATSGTSVDLVVSLGLPLIPEVANQAQAAAEAAIVAANYIVGTVTTAYSDTVATGNVISQNPAGGTAMASGTSVNLVVSLGLPIIPDVTGQAQAAAEAAITAATFTVGTVTTAYSDTVATGNVISQSITGPATSGTAVNLIVSLGLPSIPDVTGQAQAAAESAITAASFTIGTVTTAYSDTVAAGNVISQNPAGGTAIASGTAVDLVVSLGSEARNISGQVLEPDGVTPVAGIMMSASNGGNSVATDPNGYYELAVPYNWSGVVDPNAIGYTFEPNTLTFTNLTSSQTAQNFTGILDAFIISGHILQDDNVTPLEGVTLTPENGGGYFTAKYDSGGIGTSDPNGYYEVTVDYNWSGKVIPTDNAYSFVPMDNSYSNIIADLADQNYTGNLLMFSISGYVRNMNSQPLEGVTVTALNGGGTDTTDPNGYYEIGVGFGWSDSVVPSRANLKFTPMSTAYIHVNSNQTGDFTAILIQDIDANGEVSISDLLIMANNWLMPGNLNTGNLNSDEIVDLGDLSKLSEYWMQ